MKARIAFRALTGIGLVLAWLGLLLPWQQWDAPLAPSGGDDFVNGFAESRPFWIALAVATLLAAIAVFRHRPWGIVGMGLTALVLMALAAREIAENRAASSLFVSVAPGAGLVLSLVGAALLVVAVVVALRPRWIQLGAAVAAVALVAAVAIIVLIIFAANQDTSGSY